jgi:hypothetical protein
MKTRLLFILLTLFVWKTEAQGLKVGVRGAYNSTWLFSKTVSDAGDVLDYKSAFGSQVGVEALYMFNEHVGLALDVLAGSVNQKYTNRPVIGDKYESELKLKTTDIPLLFHYVVGGGAFIEAGPQLSLISGGDFSSEGISVKVDDGLSSSYLSFVFGFGYDIKLTDQLALTPGLRFSYGFGDVYEKPANAVNYEPTNAVTGGINLMLSYDFGKK